jgi:periplasmic divalent cation tolerance protein
MTVSMVVTTCEDPAEVDVLVQTLMNSRLAACAQVEEIRSRYWWKGDVADEAEYRITFKTQTRLVDDARAAIAKVHSYETPMVLSWPIDANSDYAAWVVAETTLI